MVTRTGAKGASLVIQYYSPVSMSVRGVDEKASLIECMSFKSCS